MKVLVVNSYDVLGGAARAAMRLHKSLLNIGVESEMIVQFKSSDDYTVIGPSTKTNKVINKVRLFFDTLPLSRYKNRPNTYFSPSWLPFSNAVDKINQRKPDIVHLHWINDGMLRIEDLAKINAPIVWTLHDMWPFTGGCHYSNECTRYKKSCGSCIVLNSNSENDISKKIYQRKAKIFSKLNNITIVGLSEWLNKSSENSSLFKNYTHVNLPNPIDCNIFKPIDKESSRKLWNLPFGKKLILFGAMGATSDPRKGFKELKKGLNQLKSDNVELVIFGSSKPKEYQNFGFTTHYLGKISDDVSLVTLYSAVDLVVTPSLQENLSNVIMESLSCGTPVVAFNIGGNRDLIDHKNNGYLAEEGNAKDLSIGIDWVLEHPNNSLLAKNAREKVLFNFDTEIVAQKYLQLYKSIYERI